MTRTFKLLAAIASVAVVAATSGGAKTPDQTGAKIEAAVAASSRTEANRARDKYRHPAETLKFFGVKPSDTIVEIWPGGGWYTEILVPYANSGAGTYVAAGAGERGLAAVEKLKAANPDVYRHAMTVHFPARADSPRVVTPGSADVVLTFRNVHNWMMGERPFAEDAFRQMYAMLKPGGTLGVVEHRLPESRDDAAQLTSGYVKVSTVRRLAEKAGFKLVASSEINANPKDTADYPDGVWTLPPNLRRGATDREKYLAIGESDRMTLKFVKPTK